MIVAWGIKTVVNTTSWHDLYSVFAVSPCQDSIKIVFSGEESAPISKLLQTPISHLGVIT